MKCPTCEHARENHCCHCGKRIKKGHQELTPDPYAVEMCMCEREGYDDCSCHELHLYCGTCYDNALGDI